jgi:Flp pilus assembly pilin Flp
MRSCPTDRIEARMRNPFSLLARTRDETGAATAEYAITIMAAVGFAGLLVVILKSGEVQGILSGLIRSALSVGG